MGSNTGRIGRAVALVLLVHGAGAHAAGGNDLKACTLLTQDQASALFGAPLGPGAQTSLFVGGGLSQCKFMGRPSGFLTVAVMAAAAVGVNDSLRLHSFVKTSYNADPDEVIEKVPGLGEAAFAVASGPGAQLRQTGIWILAKGRIYSIDATEAQNPAVKSALSRAGARLAALP